MRNVLRRVATAACVASLAIAAAALAAERSSTVAPEPFFRNADYASLRFSPSGKYIGALVPIRGRLTFAVFDVGTRAAAPVAAIDDQDIGSFEWVNDERIVFSVLDLQVGLGEQQGGGLFDVNR